MIPFCVYFSLNVRKILNFVKKLLQFIGEMDRIYIIEKEKKVILFGFYSTFKMR